MFSLSTTASINCSVSGPESSLLAVTLDAPSRTLAVSDRYPSTGYRASQPYCLRLLPSSKLESPVRYFMFGPSLRSPELLCPLLTSANPSRHLSITVVHDRLADLPGYCALTFALMPAAYTPKLSLQVLDFEDICLLIQLARLMRFLFVGPAFCLRLPSDSTSRWTPLPSG
jgi:hypothetical protein